MTSQIPTESDHFLQQEKKKEKKKKKKTKMSGTLCPIRTGDKQKPIKIKKINQKNNLIAKPSSRISTVIFGESQI